MPARENEGPRRGGRRADRSPARRVVAAAYAAFGLLAVGFAALAQHAFPGRPHASARRVRAAPPLTAPRFVGEARRQVAAERRALPAPPAPPPPPPTAGTLLPGDDAGPTTPS